MPNWVTNKIKFYGDKEEIKKLKKFMTTKDNNFDFNKITRIPEELNSDKYPEGSSRTLAEACAKARKEGKTTCEEFEHPWSNGRTFDELADWGDGYLSNLEKYGAATWYDWCWNNWGTKWNSCDAYWSGDDFVLFDTAWSAPEPIYAKLAELFPDVHFTVCFADEDVGSNCGTIEYSEEGLFVDYINEFEFACDVLGYDPEELREEYEEAYE